MKKLAFLVFGLLFSHHAFGVNLTGPANSVLRVPAAGGQPRFGAIDLSQSATVTNVLSVANGGTGVSSLSVQAKTSAYTTVSTDDVVTGATASGAFTVTLIGALNAVKPVKVCKADSSANLLTVSRGGSDTIQTAGGTINTSVLHRQGECIVFTSDKSSKWYMDQEERTERIYLANNGTCTITSQSGAWASSVSHGATGLCTVTLPSSIFSAAPTCTCSVVNGGGSQACYISGAPSTTAVAAATLNTSSTLTDLNSSIICQGPR